MNKNLIFLVLDLFLYQCYCEMIANTRTKDIIIMGCLMSLFFGTLLMPYLHLILNPWTNFIFLVLKEAMLCYTFYEQYQVGYTYWKEKHPNESDVNGIITSVIYAIIVIIRVILSGMCAAYLNLMGLAWLDELAMGDLAYLVLYWSNSFNINWIAKSLKLNPNQMDWGYAIFTVFYWAIVRKPVW